MEYQEIELAAAKGTPLPSHPDLRTLYCYTLLQKLYGDYYSKSIDLETAKAKKQEIRRAYEEACFYHNREAASWAQYQEFLLRANGLTYEMKRALESHADATTLMRLSLDLYAALTGDSTMADNLKRRMDDDEH